jgi:hypothetical protein
MNSDKPKTTSSRCRHYLPPSVCAYCLADSGHTYSQQMLKAFNSRRQRNLHRTAIIDEVDRLINKTHKPYV